MGLIDTKDIIDEAVLMKGLAPGIEAFRAFLEVLSASPLVNPNGFIVTITVSKKPEA
jgi:hypothetical protein